MHARGDQHVAAHRAPHDRRRRDRGALLCLMGGCLKGGGGVKQMAERGPGGWRGSKGERQTETAHRPHSGKQRQTTRHTCTMHKNQHKTGRAAQRALPLSHLGLLQGVAPRGGRVRQPVELDPADAGAAGVPDGAELQVEPRALLQAAAGAAPGSSVASECGGGGGGGRARRRRAQRRRRRPL